jgi:hypothetical protein
LPSTWSSCSPQPALCYRPLLALCPNLAATTVTTLEPRTLHQPEKLKKLSKNDCVFTPSIFRVNEKSRVVSTFICNRVQAVHRRMTGFGAEGRGDFRRKPRPLRDNVASFVGHLRNSRVSRARVCENQANTARIKGFGRDDRSFRRSRRAGPCGGASSLAPHNKPRLRPTCRQVEPQAEGPWLPAGRDR